VSKADARRSKESKRALEQLKKGLRGGSRARLRSFALRNLRSHCVPLRRARESSEASARCGPRGARARGAETLGRAGGAAKAPGTAGARWRRACVGTALGAHAQRRLRSRNLELEADCSQGSRARSRARFGCSAAPRRAGTTEPRRFSGFSASECCAPTGSGSSSSGLVRSRLHSAPRPLIRLRPRTRSFATTRWSHGGRAGLH
jgi:hypothetical protein